MKSSFDNTYCSAKDSAGHSITGWLLMDKNDLPRWFQVDCEGGYLELVETLTDIKAIRKN